MKRKKQTPETEACKKLNTSVYLYKVIRDNNVTKYGYSTVLAHAVSCISPYCNVRVTGKDAVNSSLFCIVKDIAIIHDPNVKIDISDNEYMDELCKTSGYEFHVLYYI